MLECIQPFPSEFIPFGPEQDIVHQIFAKREVHLIAGASGVGKTTWMFQFLKDWGAGKHIFGHESYPTPFCYVSSDRGENSLKKTLWRMGLMCPYISTRDMKVPGLESVIKYVLKKFPATKLIILDTIQGFMDVNMNDYKEVRIFLQVLGKLCEKYDVTIFGIGHTAKTKEGMGYADPRQKIAGSVALPGFSESGITIESSGKIGDEKRYVLNLLPRHGAEATYYYKRDDNGWFVEVEEEKEADGGFILELFVDSKQGTEWKTEELLLYGQGKKIPARTVERWLKKQVEKGKIEKGGRGKYVKANQQVTSVPGAGGEVPSQEPKETSGSSDPQQRGDNVERVEAGEEDEIESEV